jgi:hypothetical protein
LLPPEPVVAIALNTNIHIICRREKGGLYFVGEGGVVLWLKEIVKLTGVIVN